jgi:hypothetical protein
MFFLGRPEPGTLDSIDRLRITKLDQTEQGSLDLAGSSKDQPERGSLGQMTGLSFQ